MTSPNLKSEIRTDHPAELVPPTVDALSSVINAVQDDARQGAEQYLTDTLVSEGGE